MGGGTTRWRGRLCAQNDILIAMALIEPRRSRGFDPTPLVFAGVLGLGAVILVGALIGTGLIRCSWLDTESRAPEFGERRAERFLKTLVASDYEAASSHVRVTVQDDFEDIQERLRAADVLTDVRSFELEGYEPTTYEVPGYAVEVEQARVPGQFTARGGDYRFEVVVEASGRDCCYVLDFVVDEERLLTAP